MLRGIQPQRGLAVLKRTLATDAPLVEKSCASITPPYPKLIQKLEHVRRILKRPLTLSEKILYSHLVDPEKSLAGGGKIRGEAYLQLHPERVAMQDASAQMALLQFMSAGLPQCAVPTSIHCDHLIQASEGADADLKRSIISNQEVFEFLESAARKYGIEFWRPGSGIIHQIVLENYAAPGMLMSSLTISDSHTPNAGGLGMLAIGVGGADAVDAMTGTPWELKAPQVVGLATIANMGAEVGATTSTFPYTPKMNAYLKATGRAPVAIAADAAASQGFLSPDDGAEYDEVIEITRVADLARQAQAAGIKTKVAVAYCGSEQIRATMERDNVTATLEGVGAVVLANACGPCIGQWERVDRKDEENAILTSFNRNFKSRNDGNRLTMNFLASPTIVTAMSFSGKLSFNPITDSLTLPSGEAFKFTPPSGQDLPSTGFAAGEVSYYPQPNPQPQPDVQVAIKPDSQRLELLEPFTTHFGQSNSRGLELPSLKVLMRAVNDEGGDVNKAFDHDMNVSGTIPEIAKSFKARHQPWALIVDENYGEGSAREHAALQPRFYGCALILARSFARIHETNLKKQGVLPLWFADKADYSRIGSGDIIETVGLADTIRGVPGASIKIRVTKLNGEIFDIQTKHTMSRDQLKWLEAGSALNYIRSQI
ncbi:hypothetical protein C0995_002567 [Termitomyces sp. Mi166|nr:hypothetical protein C0995_002567 [Termitomyces sp. Mi166\